MVFAVLGGDERQARLAAQLLADGHEVRAFALEVAALPAEIAHCEEAALALRGADCAVLPLPVMGKMGYLNAPMTAEPRCIGEVFGAVAPGQLVCAGMPDAYVRGLAEKSGALMRDYYTREELLAVNAVATAEGALAVLMNETPRTLWKSRVLLIGWGRLGKALAPRLRALGAFVAVASRKSGDMAWTEACGFEALDTRALEGHLGGFDIVVNTVPSLVLPAPRLCELPRETLVLDLASRPGGVDFEAARALGVRVVWSLGLPGRWAPETAAGAIREAIYNILEETNGEKRP